MPTSCPRTSDRSPRLPITYDDINARDHMNAGDHMNADIVAPESAYVTFRPRPLAGSPVSPGLLDEATTLTGALAELARRYPDFECLTILNRDGTDARLSPGALWTRAQAVRWTLQARGLARGRGV